MRIFTRGIFALSVAGLAFTGFGGVLASRLEAAVAVRTVVAGEHSIEETLDLTGSVEASKTVTVYSKVTGVIEKLPVDRGAHLKKADVIALIEHATQIARRKELTAAVEAADAAVSQAIATTEVAQAAQAQAQARLENATLEKDRAENLYKDNSIPKQKYDAAVAAYKIALAGRDLAVANLHVSKASLSLANVGRKQALAALEELDTRIADYTVRAPIAGIVTARFVDQGAMDNPALPIVEIMDTSILKVCCDVAQVNAGKVREGQPVTLSVDAYPGAAFAGTVTIVNPSLDPKTRTLPIEIHTDGKPSPEKTAEGALLRPGMFVNLSIKIGKKTTLAIPRDCLLRLPGTGVYYLFVVKDSKAEKRTVQVGISRGNIVEITSGLKVGESVVIQGQANLKTGIAVMEEKGTD